MAPGRCPDARPCTSRHLRGAYTHRDADPPGGVHILPMLRASMGRLAALALVVAAAPVAAQSVDSLIALNVAARGGMARLRAVRTEWLAGHIVLGPGADAVDTVELERPLHIRTTLHLNGKTIVQASDGRTTWTINPFAGDTAPHVMEPDLAANVEAGADFDGPLIDYAAKGNRVTFAGTDTADGRPASLLRVTTAAGLQDTYFIDAGTHLQTKWSGRRVVNGDTVVYESWFRDYRSVGGVMVAFRIDSDTRGRPGVQRIRFDSAAVNVPLSPDRFRMAR